MSKFSGIYCILNKSNNKVYIGQSKDCNKRLINHKTRLKNNKHSNEHLQSAFNKYGLENFTYSIIEECNQESIDEREIYWIQYYNSFNKDFGYNIQSGVLIKH